MTTNQTTYNGFKNYETWNVSLWLNNDEGFYSVAQECDDYDDFISFVNCNGHTHTPDGVEWDDSVIDFDRMDEIIQEVN